MRLYARSPASGGPMIVARFKVVCRPERTEEMTAALAAVEAPSRALPAVRPLDVTPSLCAPHPFVVLEVFEDRAALDRQEAQPEVAAVVGLVEEGALVGEVGGTGGGASPAAGGR